MWHVHVFILEAVSGEEAFARAERFVELEGDANNWCGRVWAASEQGQAMAGSRERFPEWHGLNFHEMIAMAQLQEREYGRELYSKLRVAFGDAIPLPNDPTVFVDQMDPITAYTLYEFARWAAFQTPEANLDTFGVTELGDPNMESELPKWAVALEIHT